jgi:hypothetical protein
MPLPQAPKRQDTRVFVTPLVGDVLFSQLEDCTRREFPEYGTPHPDSAKWPDHKLVFIRSLENADRDGMYEFFYAANRDDQDLYNFETEPIQLAGITVDSVVRTYVVPRSEYNPDLPAIGSTMPSVPAGKFAGNWKLYNTIQGRIQDKELDSLFVIVRRVYVQDTVAAGVDYGEIVTADVTTQVLVPEGTAVDTGLAVLQSKVTPTGNGMAIKETRRVSGGQWPDPVEFDVLFPAPSPPSSIYWKNMRREIKSRKVGAMPTTIDLTGNQVGKEYKRETPDRVNEVVTTDSYQFYTQDDGDRFYISESIERNAYLETATKTWSDDDPSLPTIGTGSTRLVYRAGEVEIHENTAVETKALPGLKGVDTSAQSWGSLVETTNYTTSSVAPAGGSVRLIFNDGMTKVYESTTVSATPSGTTRSASSQSWGVLVKNGVYATLPSTGYGKDSRQVWSNGVTSVYLNETDAVDVSGSTLSSNAQPWGTITKSGVYATTPSTGYGKDSRQVWSNGVTSVYLNETDSVQVSGSSKDVDPQQWGSITWNGNYAQSSSGVRSRQVWSNGVTNVFLNESPTLSVTAGSFVSAKEVSRLLTETQTTTYSLAPITPSQNSRSRVVYSLNGQNVYENTDIVVAPSETPRVYGSVMQFAVPSVLKSIRTVTFPLKNGGVEVYYEPEIEEGMSGSFPCEVTEYYTESPEPPSAADLTAFKPKPISFRTPWAELRLAPTLHARFDIPYSTGTTDVKYEYIADNIQIQATEPPDWKGLTVLAAYTTQPYKNGFIVREYRITLPGTSPAPTP